MQDSSLVLTGPCRAILLFDPVAYEVELRVKGTRPSEDKVLSGQIFDYNCITRVSTSGSLLKDMAPGPRCTLEFRFAHLELALEAAIRVWASEGSTDFCGKFVARTASINANVTLLDSRDRMVSISNDGLIELSRNVVFVEGFDGRGQLIVGVWARRSDGDLWFPGRWCIDVKNCMRNVVPCSVNRILSDPQKKKNLKCLVLSVEVHIASADLVWTVSPTHVCSIIELQQI